MPAVRLCLAIEGELRGQARNPRNQRRRVASCAGHDCKRSGRLESDGATYMMQPAWITKDREQKMAKAPPSAKRDRIKNFTPALVDYTNDVVYGDLWERKGLSKRDRSLITVAALVAT